MTPARSYPRNGATQADVARLAGVSTAVVSYTLGGSPKPVAEATRLRVLEAARKLDYRPNASARALSLGRADLIGLIVPTVEQPYFAHLTLAVERAAREAGLALIVANSLPASDTGAIVRELAGRQLRGLVLASVADSDTARAVTASGTPTVVINLPKPIEGTVALGPDFHDGAFAAVRHLIDVHGHRRIAHAGGDVRFDERARGWAAAMEHSDLDAAVRIECDYSLAGGHEAMRRVLEEHPEVTAVFFASDQMAAGALAALYEAGRRVPEDMAVFAFDGSPESQFTTPPLSTVDVPLDRIARDAVARLQDPSLADVPAYRTSLRLRRSCGCE